MPDERRFTHRYGGQSHVREAAGDDEAIAQLASQQHGIVCRRQLLDVGISERTIDRRITHGQLRSIHSGVYAVGHEALSYAARVAAAVMALGPPAERISAAASHLTAASLRALCDPPRGAIDVTATQYRHPRRGIAIHRAVLPPEEVEFVDGIPITTVPRTLLDISTMGNEGLLRRLLKQAEFHELTDIAAVEAILARYPRRRGRAKLARIVERLRGLKTRSELEDRFLDFCAARGLPVPETNVVLAVRGRRYEVDCLWREAGLVVELDGRQAHDTASGFETDRARDRALIAAGLVPMRITWAHLRHDGDALEAEIRDTLAARSADKRGFTHRHGG